MFYIRPTLNNLSQGERLKYVRELRHMSKDDAAEYFDLGGERKNRTICRYENNSRIPSKERLEELANLYEVSINAIKNYDFVDPMDFVYSEMWKEEEFPYCEINIGESNYRGTDYNTKVIKGLNMWKEMKRKRENNEISFEEYIEWKLNFEL